MWTPPLLFRKGGVRDWILIEKVRYERSENPNLKKSDLRNDDPIKGTAASRRPPR